MTRLQLETMFLCVILLLGTVLALNNQDAHPLCKLVESQVPRGISYPASTVYNESQSSYYSGQERDLQPACIFSPQNAHDVSYFIKTITTSGSSPPQFAIRSGGHMIWSGAANIQGGITVDLRALNSLVLSEDKKTASIGSGGIWSDIYTQLVPHNLTVMGGRVPGIGVGGLSTGGGISYFSRRHGWVCDNIHLYEVVLASGTIVQATATSHRDLWLALKGGSNNFGIVTRIEVPTILLSRMWGGGLTFSYTPAVLDAQAASFSAFMDTSQGFDDAADMGLALVFQNPGEAYAVGNSLFYVGDVIGEGPETYRRFLDIPDRVGGSLRVADVSNITLESTGELPPHATRAIDIVHSFKNGGPELYSLLFQVWEEGTASLTHIEGLQLVLLIQPHPVTNGTNSLGLTPGVKDEVMAVLTGAYKNMEDDGVVQSGMQAIIDRQVEVTQSKGLYIPYQYLNYADKFQDPIRSYGEGVRERLQAVSKKYDPDGLFQRGVPGGFKVFE